ncbi:complement C3-like [Engraulis encrasicolus]|uniref:complement C3-like n=1 Tax=Engraulis encrasicolus TaxID=184585 RepID=UPI002FD19F6E
MKQVQLCWPACLVLCLVVFSHHADAGAQVQCPDKCSPQKTGVKTLAELTHTACHASTKFVFEVTVENMESSLTTDAYNISMLEVFKYGADDPMDQERIFISVPSCKSQLGLKPGNNYLIMGQASSIKQVAGKYYYMFDEHTWLQYWPTDVQGQSDAYKNQYDNLEQFRNDMSFGCKS